MGSVGKCRDKSRKSTCKQTIKIYEHFHRPVCQYIATCVIIELKLIMLKGV